MGKAKQAKRSLTFYRVTWKLSSPFHVIVHPEALRQSIIQQINLREQLPNILQDKFVLSTTKCILNELKTVFGGDKLGSSIQARKFRMIPCSHRKTVSLDDEEQTSRKSTDNNTEQSEETDNQEVHSDLNTNFVSADSCIKHVIENTPNLIVLVSVTQQNSINRHKYFKVPFILLTTSPPSLSILPPSTKALSEAKKSEKQQREALADYEIKLLEKNSESNTEQTQITGKKRKRKTKAPNPLSCKKKKTVDPTVPKVVTNLESDSQPQKKKRTRRKNRKSNITEIEREIQKGIEREIQKGIEEGIEEGIEREIQKGIEREIQKGIEEEIEREIEKGIEEEIERDRERNRGKE